MSPTAIHVSSQRTVENITSVVKGPALVIGSLSAAQNGKYQKSISELESTRKVDRQLLDRIVDEGTIEVFFSSEPIPHNSSSYHPWAFILLFGLRYTRRI